MKIVRVLAFCTVVLSSTFFYSCSKSHDEEKEGDSPAVVSDGEYVCRLEVSSETPYIQESVDLRISPSGDNSVEIKIYNVRFSSRMPITLSEMIISNVEKSVEGETLSLKGDNLVPTAMGNPFPSYTVKGLSGCVAGDSISLNMTIGDYPTKFAGKKKP